MKTSAQEILGLPAEEAIPRLLDLYGPKLYRLGLRVCGDADEAADLFQDIFLTAFRKWGQFEGLSAPSSWLYTIAVRACRRRHRRRAGEPARLAPLEAPSASGEAASVGLDPEGELLHREATELVGRAITALPLPYRLPLVLKELAELPVADIARLLGLKEATVKTRLHRARLRLRDAIVEPPGATGDPPTDHRREVCLDLLQAKQEALDRGVDFPVHPELCTRCRTLFEGLDLAQEACRRLAAGELPPVLRELLLARIGGTPRH